MGQRGPRPKNPALKLLAGNPGKRPAGTSTGRGRVRKGVPDRPPEVTGEAAREWDRLAPELDAAGLLAVTDRGILAAYCLAVADLLAARDTINREGRFLSTPIQSAKGVVIGTATREHPAVKLLDRATARVQRLAAELGITPAARARLEGDGGEVAAPVGNKVLEIRARIEAARALPPSASG